MRFLDYQGLQEYDTLIKQYIQNNIPESAEIAEALQNAYNPNSTIRIAICTQAEYNALQNPEQNVLYIISDETSEVVNVEANPTLDGTESVLGSIKIGGVNYAMPSGGGGGSVELYEHKIVMTTTSMRPSSNGTLSFRIISSSSTPFSTSTIFDYLSPSYIIPASGSMYGTTNATANEFGIVFGINCNAGGNIQIHIVKYSFDFTNGSIARTTRTDYAVTDEKYFNYIVDNVTQIL